MPKQVEGPTKNGRHIHNPKALRPPPKTLYYPDPDKDDPDDSEDDSEALGMEPSEPGGSANKVEEGDCIFVMTYIPLEAISATSMISQ